MGVTIRRGTKPGTFPGEMLSQEGNRVFMCRGVPQQHGRSFLNLRRAVEAWDHCDLGLFFFFFKSIIDRYPGSFMGYAKQEGSKALKSACLGYLKNNLMCKKLSLAPAGFFTNRS